MKDGAITGKGAMKKQQSESEPHESAAPSGGAKRAHEAKARAQPDADAVARAVLEALSAHDSM